MGLETAKATLARARKELAKATDNEDIRQAAEKGWRAAREAVYTVISSMERRPHGTLSPSTVASFEAKYLDAERGGGYLSGGYAHAIQVLHGECFYDGVMKSSDEMRLELDSVDTLIEDAEYALRTLRGKRKLRKHNRRD